MPTATAPLDASEIVGWPRLPKGDIIDRIAVVVQDLFGLYRELSMLEAEEARARTTAFATSEWESVSGREKDASAAAMPNRVAVLECRRKIEALEVVKEFGYFLVGLG